MCSHACNKLRLLGYCRLHLLSENGELVFIRGRDVLEPFFGRKSGLGWLPETRRVSIGAEFALREGHEGLRLPLSLLRGWLEICLRVEG